MMLIIVLVAISCFVHTCQGTCNHISTASPLNWSLSIDCCTWEGVDCDDSGRVTNMWLPLRGLVGSISSSIVNVNSLSRFNLSHNWLVGRLPDGFFVSLKLLQQQQLLGANYFNYLQYFASIQFSNNDFTGLIPQGFGRCKNMQRLRSGFNNISGGVPRDINRLLTLQELYLPGNKLSGEIDKTIVNLGSIRIFALYVNELTCMIPQDIRKLSKLEQLQLHINQLLGLLQVYLINFFHNLIKSNLIN
ncbi:hypothetical protein ACJIZ3_003563 [Penstemon smallii]|uniref:Leucine-rich repeat-containing N-terminal plant-type domain-containing protein n=1 Tax=Penstemon smallii TaxID=265156 RepID=A0ABD3UCP1_9LAMI